MSATDELTSATDEPAAGEDDGEGGLIHAMGVAAGVVLSGCSSLAGRSQPLNENPSGIGRERLSGRSAATKDSSSTPTPSPTATDDPSATSSPTATESSTPTPESPTAEPSTASPTEEPATATATETARPADADGTGGSGAVVSSGGGGTSAASSTATPTPDGTTETTTSDGSTRELRTPVETVSSRLSTPLTGTITVSSRETGYLCLVDVDSPVSVSFAGETVDGGAVNWYLCDPATLDSYWTGGMAGVFAPFTDWSAFDFGPYTTGAGPTALVVEPVGEAVTLSYSIDVQ